MELVKVEDFNYTIIDGLEDLVRAKGNQGTRDRPSYKNLVCAFDIETSYIKELDINVIYIWQFQLDEVMTIIGRTWYSFMEFNKRIKEKLPENTYLVTYIHNASYEFQFLRSLYNLDPQDVFVIKSRRILKFRAGAFEFRCSYLQSNLSLAAFTSKMRVEHQKLSGKDFDYSITRYSDTPLTDKELEYCVNDVRGLVEAIKAEMARDEDTLYTIPLTSTGYVRRDVRQALREWGRYKLNDLFPPADVYVLQREAFRGGNVHANRFFVKNADFPLPPLENVHSADRSSSYPDCQFDYPYPMTPFRRVEKDSIPYSMLKDHYIKRRGYALLFRMQITECKLRDLYNPCPYLSYSKCRNVLGKVLDNGRILAADYLEVTVTDIDFKIIDKQYSLSDENVVITDLYFSTYGMLPDPMRALVLYYYKQKTELKGVKEQKLYYDKFKALINAIYGCSAQDPGKDNILYLEDGTEEDPEDIYSPEAKALVDILSDAHPTMPYQWGVWTTARARELLQLMIDAVHEHEGSEFVYTDTDSVKYIGDFDLEEINKDLRALAEKNGAYADDIKGNRHYMGVYEDEGTYKRFETLGAKSYVYEDVSGHLHITIAGVPKDAGAAELERMGGFDAYKVGAIFRDGITETYYRDKRTFECAEVDGHKIEITSNLVIKPSFHQIGIGKDYKHLLDNLDKEFLEKLHLI